MLAFASLLLVAGCVTTYGDLSEDVTELSEDDELPAVDILLQDEDGQQLSGPAGEPTPLDKLSSELKNLHQIRKEADQMLHSAGQAVKNLNQAVTTKSGEGGTIAAGADGGDTIAQLAKAIDPKTDKCTDFYQYACGSWMKNTKIPNDAASWTKTFSEISKANHKVQKRLYQKNETSKYTTVAKEEIQMVKQYYSSCMDSAGRDARGLKDGNFTSLLKQITAVKDAKALMELYGNWTLLGIDVGPFGFGVGLDEKNSKKNVAGVNQGGIGLPSRNYYGVVKDNERFKKVRMAYVKFMEGMFKMADVKADPQAVLSFETQIAKIMWGKVQMRDPVATYFATTIGNFTKEHLSFGHYFKPIRKKYPAFDDNAKFVVSPIKYFKRLEELLAKTNIETLKGYTMRQFLSGIMPATTTEAGDLNFNFYGKMLSGAKKRPVEWKRCVGGTTSALWGMADRMFIEKKFQGDSKKVANEMLDFIVKAFADELDKNTWMDEATVAAAKKKLSKMNRKVGFPDVWPKYTGLSVGDNFLQNVLSSKKVEADRNLKKLGQEVDSTEWSMNPSMTNAYYAPSRNEMVFPAGILQPPFFSTESPAVINFGSVGSVMGHELTHGFDDSGAKFDADGNMKIWWSNQSMTQFKNKTNCMIKQYEKIPLPELAKAAPKLKINGKLTLGENIADNGGVKAAYYAYKAWAKAKDTPTEYQVDGKTVTSEQLYFVSYGQVWCSISAPKAIMVRIRSDPHSPNRARVIGPMQNSKEFASVMQCPEGTPLNQKNKCDIW